MRQIDASELIINSDGSVFHLHLRPEHLRDNIILVGDPGRVAVVAALFDSIDYDIQNREFRSMGGSFHGKPVMAVSHGIGADNMEITVTELDALANVSFDTRCPGERPTSLRFVRIGTSGSLQEDIHVGDFVMADKAIGTDGILNYYADADSVCDVRMQRLLADRLDWPQTWATPYVADASPALADRIAGNDILRGITVSALGFYAPQGRRIRLPLVMPEIVDRFAAFRYQDHAITNFEMEGAALYGLARLLGHEAATVCCIIAERRNSSADTDYSPHIQRLIRIVLERI